MVYGDGTSFVKMTENGDVLDKKVIVHNLIWSGMGTRDKLIIHDGYGNEFVNVESAGLERTMQLLFCEEFIQSPEIVQIDSGEVILHVSKYYEE